MEFLPAALAAGGTYAVTSAILVRYRRWRQKSPGGRANFTFKARLPSWLKNIELMLWGDDVALDFFILFWAGLSIRARFHPALTNETAIGILAFSNLLAALPPAMLLSNVVSWLIPAMRRTNLDAMEGLPVSFSSANAELFQVAIITTPISVVTMLLALWLP